MAKGTTGANCETVGDLKDMLNTSMTNVVSNNNLVTQLTQKAMQNMLSIGEIKMEMETLKSTHSEELAKLKEQIAGIKTELTSQRANANTLAAVYEENTEELADMSEGVKILSAQG